MKYLGGKNNIGKYIAEFLKQQVPSDKVKGYLEPFCGSLGVTVHMTDEYKVKAGDSHPDLIQLWKEVQSGEFKIPRTMSEKRWLKIKDMKSPSALKAFAGFGCSFGGKFFGGYAQKYTNGKNENFLRAAQNSIKKIQPKIQNVTFKCIDYKKWRPHGYLIYCDPPYAAVNFEIKYRKTTKKYDNFNQKEFWNTMRKWSKDNYVFISEVKAPPDFVNIWSKSVYRSASQSSKTRYKSKHTKKYNTEKLFVHKSSLLLK